MQNYSKIALHALFEFEFHFNMQIRHTHTLSATAKQHTHTHRSSECDVMAKMFVPVTAVNIGVPGTAVNIGVPGTAVSIGATLLKLTTTDDMTSISSIASLLHQL